MAYNIITGEQTSIAERLAYEPDDVTNDHIIDLLDELEIAVNHGWYWRHRSDKAYDARWCIWPGQNDEGVRRLEDGDDSIEGRWDGASDTRIRLVDEKIREAVKVRNAAQRRARMSIKANRPDVENYEDKVSLLVRWTKNTKMRSNYRIERQLANDWAIMYGLCISMVEWEELSQYHMEEVNIPLLLQVFGIPIEFPPDTPGEAYQRAAEEIAQQDPELADELLNALDIINNPDRASELVETLTILFPTIGKSELREAAKEIRETGITELPFPGVGVSRPRRKALLPFYNVFFPADTPSVEEARWIAIREWVPLADIDDRAKAEGWPEDFTEAVKQTEGMVSFDGQEMRMRYGYERGRAGSTGSYGGSSTANDATGRVELYIFYNWAVDTNGVRGLYRTVTSRHVPRDIGELIDITQKSRTARRTIVPDSIAGAHAIYAAKHGKMPFVEHNFYRDGDRMIDAVGLPWLLWQFQNEIKKHRDTRHDMADIHSLPPLRRHPMDMDTPIALGPDLPVSESIPGSTEWMKPPDVSPFMTIELEKSVRYDAGRIAGSPEEGVPDLVVQLNHEDLADCWLSEESEVDTLILQVMQDNMEEETVLRVAGNIDRPFTMTGEEIRGQFDLQLQYDVRELDPKFAAAKREQLGNIIARDTTGRIDRGKSIEIELNTLDGFWADFLLVPQDTATKKDLEDEKNKVAQILGGQEPTPEENPTNPELRRNYMAGLIQGEQASPAIQAILENDETIQKLFMARLQSHEFQLDQIQNAQIGRDGYVPVLTG